MLDELLLLLLRRFEEEEDDAAAEAATTPFRLPAATTSVVVVALLLSFSGDLSRGAPASSSGRVGLGCFRGDLGGVAGDLVRCVDDAMSSVVSSGRGGLFPSPDFFDGDLGGEGDLTAARDGASGFFPPRDCF